MPALRFVAFALCLAVLALLPASKAARAQSGVEWTTLILGGAAAASEFGYRLPVYAAKLRGTVREAEATARATYDSTAQGTVNVALTAEPEPDSVTIALPGGQPVSCPPSAADQTATTPLASGQCVFTLAPDGKQMTVRYAIGGAESLDQVRARIIQTVVFMPKSAPPGVTPKEWRRPYETLRACWNRLIYREPAAPAKASKDDVPAAKPNVASEATPSPPPLIAPGSCAAGVVPEGQPLEIVFAGNYVDLVDAASAFSDAPSLRQQIVDQRVGTYRSDNVERAEVLARLGGAFFASSPAAVPVVRYRLKPAGPFAPHTEQANALPGEINAGYTSCVVKFSPFGCYSALDTVEKSLESSLANSAGCRFARRYWLPPVGTIARVYATQMIASAAPDYWPFPTANSPVDVPSSPTLAQIEGESGFGAVPGC